MSGSNVRHNGLESETVRVPVGARHAARLTVADPYFGHDAGTVHNLLEVLGLLDDVTVPEVGESWPT